MKLTGAQLRELAMLLDAGPGGLWVGFCQLPPYAHELNPVEPVWSHLKRSLANLAKRDLAQLTALVKTRLRRMQYRPALLDGFLASTGLDLTPFRNPRN
jgi:DDE superfamily endonuclease